MDDATQRGTDQTKILDGEQQIETIEH